MKRSGVACRLPVSLKTERAARSLGPSLGWPWLCMVGTRQKRVSPLWGNDSARETARCALLSTTPVTPVPPPWVWALPTVSSAGDGGPPGAPCFLARRRYLRPSPTALPCYRAPRREDKSDTEETVFARSTRVADGIVIEGSLPLPSPRACPTTRSTLKRSTRPSSDRQPTSSDYPCRLPTLQSALASPLAVSTRSSNSKRALTKRRPRPQRRPNSIRTTNAPSMSD